MSESKEIKGRADPIDHIVSKKLKLRRMILGLSQQQLGAAVGVSIQQVQKYEKATNRISSGKLYSFAQFLKVPLDYFFTQIDDNNTPIENIFAEEAEEYNTNTKLAHVSEKEVIALIKAFGDVKNPQIRKKIVELVKALP